MSSIALRIAVSVHCLAGAVELGQDTRQRVCSESQLRNTVGLLAGAAVGLVLVALLVAALVIAALIPAVVQFGPQTCKHWENIAWQLAVQLCWPWAVIIEATSIIAAVISFICPLRAGVTRNLSVTQHHKRANEVQKRVARVWR